MTIAFYGRQFANEYLKNIQDMATDLEVITDKFLIHEKLYSFLIENIKFNKPVEMFSSHNDLNKDLFCLISIGGDGTLLDTLSLIRDSGIPVLGINTGRLGFLSAVSALDVSQATACLINRKFRIDSRALIHVNSPKEIFDGFAYALNELTIMKRDTSSMITIRVSINDKHLNTYWADGIIVATPTGSTGYSLSCGGPIISPESQNFIITPIASHNLTVRPIVTTDNTTIKLNIEGRNKDYLLVLDSRSIALNESFTFEVKKADFTFNLIYPESTDFYQTIRNKLTWGLDKRN